jgi:hypothetical protein
VELAEPNSEPAHELMSHLGKNLKHYQTKDTKTDFRHRKHFSVWVFIRIPNCKLPVTSVVQTIFRKNAETKFVVVFGLNCCLKYSSDAFLVVKADYEVTLCNIMFYII